MQVPKPITPATTRAASNTYVFSCEGPDAHDSVVKTLVGEYVEHCNHHFRKAYKRSSDPKSGTVDVYMYYWDHRDGPAYHGWWLGNQLGGSHVWSHSDSDSLLPPLGGWKILGDGKIRPSLKAAPKAAADAEDATALQQIAGEGVEAMENAEKAVEDMRAAIADPSKSEFIDQALETLKSQVQPLSEALRKVLEPQRSGSWIPGSEAVERLVQVSARIRKAQRMVANEVASLAKSGKAGFYQEVNMMNHKDEKDFALARVLERRRKTKALVFVAKNTHCDNIERMLLKEGILASAMHNGKDPPQRQKSLELFESDQRPVLIVTDTAVRGLDIKDVNLVVNYDAANNVEDHMHRISRAGPNGWSATFLLEWEDARKSVGIAEAMQKAGCEIPIQMKHVVDRVLAKRQELTVREKCWENHSKVNPLLKENAGSGSTGRDKQDKGKGKGKAARKGKGKGNNGKGEKGKDSKGGGKEGNGKSNGKGHRGLWERKGAGKGK